MAGNNDYCVLKSRLTFNAAGTEKYIVHVTGYGNGLEEFKLYVGCEYLGTNTGTQEINYGESVTASTINVPNILEADFCGVLPSASSGLIYNLSNISGLVTLSTCHVEIGFDTLIQMFQVTVLGRRVDGNDGVDN